MENIYNDTENRWRQENIENKSPYYLPCAFSSSINFRDILRKLVRKIIFLVYSPIVGKIFANIR